jgi:hypothetical protein
MAVFGYFGKHFKQQMSKASNGQVKQWPPKSAIV